jgi:hypothetical protein
LARAAETLLTMLPRPLALLLLAACLKVSYASFQVELAGLKVSRPTAKSWWLHVLHKQQQLLLCQTLTCCFFSDYRSSTQSPARAGASCMLLLVLLVLLLQS